MLKGWDFFTTELDVKSMHCKVCDANMNHWTAKGPRSWAESMAGVKVEHEMWTCPHTEKDWHKQALAIFMEARATPSNITALALIEEAKEIVNTQTATKKVWSTL